MRYAREVAFATAEVYARAAEMRGAWDARLEALVVDSVLRAEADETVRSRASALGWESKGAVVVVLGRVPDGDAAGRARESIIDDVRRSARHVGLDALCAVQGDRLVVVLGGVDNPDKAGAAVAEHFGEGPVVVGPVVPDLVHAQHLGPRRDRRAARRAGLAGGAPAGDQRRPAARAGAVRRRARPPAAGRRRSTCRSPRPARRPWRRCRRSSTTAARSRAPRGRCSCTPNTVRYRLRRAAEVTGLYARRPAPRLHLPGRADPRPARRAGLDDTRAAVKRLCRVPTRTRPGIFVCAEHAVRALGATELTCARHRRSRPGGPDPRLPDPLAREPGLPDRLDWLSAVAGLDLVHYGTEADADTIRDTAVAQPLLVASGLLAALELFPHPADAFDQIGAVAGHSVGELAAAAGARRDHRRAGHGAGPRARPARWPTPPKTTPTSMTAVLGGDRDEVLAKLDAARPDRRQRQRPRPDRRRRHRRAARGARRRPAGQGPADAAVGRRRVPHRAHGARPSRCSARLARSVSTHDPRIPLISNRDGQVVHDGREVLKRIVTQVSNPVRWDLCMETMLDLGVTGMLEMPPAGTLTGIARRAMKGVETFALKTPDQLDDARAFIDKHGGASHIDTNPTWRMLVAPAKGTFHQTADLPEGGAIAPGTAIGAVQSLRRTRPRSTAPYGGTIVEWLVEDGDLVSPGQPLIRLHPEGVNA